MRFSTITGLAAALLPSLGNAWLSTDTLQDADSPQSGYLPNHNLDPSYLGGMTLNWSLTFTSAEQHHAKPLVWTPPGGGNELVILVSNKNFIRVIDGITGVVKYSRQVDAAFASTDVECGDIPTTVGITSTPLIDKNTNIMYFTSKAYKNGLAGPQGVINGQYKLYAVTLPGLQDIPGWPYIIPNKGADNDPARYFIGGTVLQRTGLVQVGNSIVMGWGGHCDNFNYTGLIMAVSKTTGVGLTGMHAMIAAPDAPPQALDITDQSSGMAGIWQSGMALAVDEANNRVFFATGNTHGPGINRAGTPRSGKIPISTLEQSVVNFGVDPATGKLTQADWWQAVDYDDYNGGDRDLSSSGVVLLDPFFSGGGINRVAVAAGKNGYVYFMDADNLGGFKMGPGGTDAILQKLGTFPNSFFSGVANYPLEGGYIYWVSTGNVLYCYKFTPGADGKPFFTLAGSSTMTFAAKGVPVITTNNGQPGTGIVWLTDVNMGLVAYQAIPVNGVMQQIPLGLATGRLQKNMRPVFGNGRVYVMGNTKIMAVANKNVVPGSVVTPTVGPSSIVSSTVSTSSSTSTSTTSSSVSSSVSLSSSTSTTVSSSTSTTSSTSSTSTPTTSTSTSTSTSSSSSPSSSTVATTTSQTSTSTSATPVPTGPVVPATIDPGWSYLSCYTEATTGRALSVKNFANDSMTLELCAAFCDTYKTQYFGVEYSRECYCGNAFNAGSVPAPQSDCPKVCKANAFQYCGGSKRLSVYTKGAVVVSSSSTTTSSSSTTSSSIVGSSTSSSVADSSTLSSVISTSTSTSSTTSDISTSTTSSSTSQVTTSSSSTISSTSTTSSSATSSSSTVIPSRACTPSIPVGKLITLNWNIGYVNAAPDGFARRFIGINGQWPNPPITGTLGDTIKINVVNGLGDQHTSIHFHGMFQQNTTFEDGPVGVTQCPIPPGQSFVYQFRLLQTGTYWYHAHIGGQYIDGFRGPLIIKDPCAPYKSDGEMTLTLSDLYHTEAPQLVNYYLSPDNSDATGGTEPVPDAALMNESQNPQFPVTAGKTYMVHIINMGAMAGMYLQFDQHRVTVIEADGVWVMPYDTDQLFVAVAQRYTVLLTAKTSSSQNYAIVASMNPDMFGSIAQPGNPTVTGYLVYNSGASMPAPFALQRQPWDDTDLVPFEAEALYDGPIFQIFLTVSFGTDAYYSTRAMFNGQSYVSQKVPTMFTALSAPADVIMNPAIYGRGTNPFVIPFNAVVEVHINNHDERAHPFHLHGHTFQIVERAGTGNPLFPGLDEPATTNPMRRDTVVVYGDSTATLRFRADNPGIWLFHCHTEWHVESGLTATFIEAPDVMVARAPYIPNSHKTVCDALGIPRKGNAAGNSKTGQWLNTTGENLAPGDPALNFGALVAPPA